MKGRVEGQGCWTRGVKKRSVLRVPPSAIASPLRVKCQRVYFLNTMFLLWFILSLLTAMAGLIAALVLPLVMAHRVWTGGAVISLLLFLMSVLSYLVGLILQSNELMQEKRCQDGSVEKYRAPKDHEVAGQYDEGEFADLSPPTSRPDMISQSSFDHRDNGFHLNSLSVGLAVEADLHQSSVLTAGRLAGGPAVLGWKD